MKHELRPPVKIQTTNRHSIPLTSSDKQVRGKNLMEFISSTLADGLYKKQSRILGISKPKYVNDWVWVTNCNGESNALFDINDEVGVSIWRRP